MDATVSVITVCFKDHDGLLRTSKSVLSQDLPVEWIIIDADSGEGIRKLLGSFTSDKHEIKWISETDRGLYDGMNKGVSLSTGNILCFLNSGDEFAESTTIKKVLDSWKSHHWSWATGLAVRFEGIDKPVSVWEYLEPELSGLALGTRTFCHQATFYSRPLLYKVGPYVLDNLAADHLLNIRCFKLTKPQIIPHVLTFFYNGGVSSRRPFSASMKDLRNLRKRENLLLLNSDTLDLIISKVVVVLVNTGGILYKSLRKLSRNLVNEKPRLSP